jgi:uncharacterized membrane protein
MDTTSTILFLAVTLGVLLVVAYLDKIDRIMEKILFHRTTVYTTELQALLLIALTAVFAQLGRALSVLDWTSSLSFALIAVVIIVFILYVRHKSDYRQRWMNAQSMRNFASLIKSAVKEALKEDREESIASMKDAFKQALKEDRKETDNSKRDSQ